ncbi:MAG: rRNA maturation RNase YbeY [Heliobacteriaceae bacterium]|nr:rRNA maturation RNase YbeY [Heliobacteriaceae bacterium]
MKLNIFSHIEGRGEGLNERKFINIAKKVLKYYLLTVREKSCLAGLEFDTISFDILYCDSAKTHQINREYRSKDYPADIITFAIFADSDEKFIFDGEINLGEIIIAPDKVEGGEDGLAFLISHGILHLLGFDHQTEADYNFVVELQKEALK